MAPIDNSRVSSELWKKIVSKSKTHVFRLGLEEKKILEIETGEVIKHGASYFQLVPGSSGEEFYLFKIKKGALEDGYGITDGEFLLKGKKCKVEVLSSSDIIKELEAQDAEPLTNSEFVDVSEEETPEPEIKSKEFQDLYNPRLQAHADVENKKHRDREFQRALDNFWYQHVESGLSGSNQFWFTSEKRLDEAEEFWKELNFYYKSIKGDLFKKISPITEEDIPPVFSKREHKYINLQDLHEAVADRIRQRISELDESREKIKQQLVEVGDRLIRRGVDTNDDENYNRLFSEQQSIYDCIRRACDSLDNYSEYFKKVEESANQVINKSVIDIQGNKEIISKHYETITKKLVSLNLEIGEIHKHQIELEHELVRRLRDVEDARGLQDWIAQLSKEQLIEDYQEENKEDLIRKEQRDIYRELGSIAENTAFIQQKIEDEKKKLKYYTDNLKSLSSYGNYEVSINELNQRKRQLRKDTLKFKREIYTLKNHIQRKEQKHDLFFSNVSNEITSLRKDVFSAIQENNSLVDKCLSTWRGRWDTEGAPAIEEMFSRTSRIVEAFAPLPASHIVKLYQLKKRIAEEVTARQREWNRVFDEIKLEFKNMKYELETPLPSELDHKYLSQLDSANLSLSDEVKKAVFFSKNSFKLSGVADPKIGLNPRTMNDDSFIIIDQVWEELTPEQEKELERKIGQEMEAQRLESNRQNKEFLVKEQLTAIKNRFVAQMARMEPGSEPVSQSERLEKYRNIEGAELHIWKRDNYLISNAKGNFSDSLYEITKKLFSLKSVRLEDKKMKFTDTGFVKDGNTAIMSAQDYFIKPEDRIPFIYSDDEVDLSESVDIHNENMIEELADPEYVSHMREREEQLAKLSAPMKPSISQWAQTSLQKYNEEKNKAADVEQLRGKLLEMQDEIAALKKYHANKSDQLDQAISDRNESFDALKEEISKAKDFLLNKDQELNDIFSKAEKESDLHIESEMEAHKAEKPAPESKPKKHGVLYWLNRWVNGIKDKEIEDDFTAE